MACGDPNTYSKGCRCPACTEAWRLAVAERRRRRRPTVLRNRAAKKRIEASMLETEAEHLERELATAPPPEEEG